jgi:hypothetical protein
MDGTAFSGGETLKNLGERGDIIKRIHKAKRIHEAMPGRAGDYRIYDASNGAVVEGVVRHKGLHDEQKGRRQPGAHQS